MNIFVRLNELTIQVSEKVNLAKMFYLTTNDFLIILGLVF